jgi:hypothetical protein
VTIVVDLGCAEHRGIRSMRELAREYEPDLIYGFDPGLPRSRRTTVGGIPAVLRRAAAWTHNGTVLFHEDGWSSRIGEYGGEVPCFDFSAWLQEMEPDRLIVKMDIEGAEVQVLEKMMVDGSDALVSELLVEWHGVGEELEERLRCPVRHWWL